LNQRPLGDDCRPVIGWLATVRVEDLDQEEQLEGREAAGYPEGRAPCR
jgi:hypothetical protein